MYFWHRIRNPCKKLRILNEKKLRLMHFWYFLVQKCWKLQKSRATICFDLILFDFVCFVCICLYFCIFVVFLFCFYDCLMIFDDSWWFVDDLLMTFLMIFWWFFCDFLMICLMIFRECENKLKTKKMRTNRRLRMVRVSSFFVEILGVDVRNTENMFFSIPSKTHRFD